MSKSRGNIVRATPIADVAGVDALRYFLLREIVFGQDGSFSYDALVGRYNSDLANGLGNLASRTLSMIEQYRQGTIPAAQERHLADVVDGTIASVNQHYENLEFSRGLEAVWSLLSAVDKYIVEQAPWKLIKDPSAEAQAKLDTTLYTAAEVLRVTAVLLAPVLPESAGKLWKQLGLAPPLEEQRIDKLAYGELPPGQPIARGEAIFPRLDAKTAIERMRELEEQETARQNALLGRTSAPVEAQDGRPAASPPITIDDFAKVDLRVGVVVSAEPVKGADKLLHLHVDIGEDKPRSIVAGIAGAYRPEELTGRKVVIVANLQPRKLRGIPSEGMIVAASLEGGKPVLAGFLEDVPVGARLK
jgi:methionyl-tRNA synthetase